MLDSLNETAITGTKKNIKKLRTTPVCLRKTPTTEKHKNTHNRTKPAPLN